MDFTQQSLQAIVEHYGDMRANLGAVKFYDHLAGLLSKIANRDKPWTWRYIQGVEAGTIDASPAFAHAVNALGAILDDTPPILAYTVEVKVYARPGTLPPFGALVLAEARPCAWPGCTVVFVPKTPNQRYCNKELHKRARRRA